MEGAGGVADKEEADVERLGMASQWSSLTTAASASGLRPISQRAIRIESV